MNTNQRKIVIVDRELQHGLSRRLITYWAGTWLMVFVLPIIARMFTEPMPADQLALAIFQDFWFPMLVSIFLLPIVVWDSIRFSNRCAGPVYRIGNTIRDMAKGKPVREIRLRPDDFCGELADSVNSLMEIRAEQAEAAVADQSAMEPVA